MNYIIKLCKNMDTPEYKISNKNNSHEYNYKEKGQDKSIQRRGRICGKHLEKKKLKEN